MSQIDTHIPDEATDTLDTPSDAARSVAGEAVARAAGHGSPGLAAGGGAWTARASFWTLNASHVIIDVYPIFLASLVLALEERLALTNQQLLIVFATGPIVSGLPQALFAWLTDRLDSRIFGWLGLLIGAVCLCSIGFATNFWQLWALQIIGLLGTGSYHPIGAALAGQLGAQVKRQVSVNRGRAWGVSVFYTAGMVGGLIGAYSCVRINKWFGMEHLAWLIIPGVFCAAMLWAATRAVPHRHNNHRELHTNITPEEQRVRWATVWLLFVGNVVRFTVNTGLPVLFAVWAKSKIPADSESASVLNGNLLAALTVGMGIFGISAGRLSPPGKEKRSILILTLLGSISVAGSGFAGTHFGIWAMYVAAGLSALGFAAVIPTSISLAQRLLPGRTGLASGLMLGSSWGLSFTAPWLAEWFLGSKLSEAFRLNAAQIDTAFVWLGAVMLIAMLATAAMPSWLLKKVAK